MGSNNRQDCADPEISEVTIIDARDARDIAELGIVAWGGNPTEDAVAERARRLHAEMEHADPDTLGMFVARIRRTIVGFAKVQQDAHNPAEWLWVALVVHPDHRRKGIARALFDASVAYARKRGTTMLRSETHAENAASIAVHENLGFHNDGPFKCPYDGDEKVAFSLSLHDCNDTEGEEK